MFENRKEAGLQLAKELEKYKDQPVIVLGIPRGGVVPAYYVAKHLDAEFSIMIAGKVGYPYNPELAFGAIAEDGSSHFNQHILNELDKASIDELIQKTKKEIDERVNELREGRPLPNIKGKTVILVDDGIATGATIFAGIELCKHQQAGKIVVAAPVSGPIIDKKISKHVDEVIILEKPPFYRGVSQVYRHFEQVTNRAALKYLKQWEQGHQMKTHENVDEK